MYIDLNNSSNCNDIRNITWQNKKKTIMRKTIPCKLGADAGAAGGGNCGVGGGLLLLGAWSPGADAARVAVLNPGAR